MPEQIRTKIRRCVPNALTLCNSLCGFAAILNMLRAYEFGLTFREQLNVFVTSAVMIFAAMVFDAMDGFAARTLHVQSETGIQMDSLSDMVTFGVAPAAMVAIMNHCVFGYSLEKPQVIVVYLLCSLYLGCAALRLAIYNVEAAKPAKPSTGRFSGMPSPGAAAAICVVVFAIAEMKDCEWAKTAITGLPYYAGVLGLLMVSHISYLHVGKWIISMFHSPKKLVSFAILLAVAIIFRTMGILVIVTGYVLSGLLGSSLKLAKSGFKRR